MGEQIISSHYALLGSGDSQMILRDYTGPVCPVRHRAPVLPCARCLDLTQRSHAHPTRSSWNPECLTCGSINSSRIFPTHPIRQNQPRVLTSRSIQAQVTPPITFGFGFGSRFWSGGWSALDGTARNPVNICCHVSNRAQQDIILV